MTPNDFSQASLSKLERLTGIDRFRWSRYLNGKVAPNERTLNKASEKLGMEAAELLAAIAARRAQKGIVLKDNTVRS